jgi:anti-sigma factor RsiW
VTTRPIAEDELHAYVDGQLDPGRRAEVEEYLSRHPSVGQRIAGYSQQRQQLREALAPLAEAPIPPELNLDRMIAARRQILARRWRTAGAAAAAVALVALGGTGGWTLRNATLPSQSGIAAVAREAAESYAVYGPDQAHPVEIRARDRAELREWIARRTGLSLAAPELSASGYRFMGGRIVATAHGPAALFMYDNDRGARLVLLARPMAKKDKEAPLSQYEDADLSGFAWATNGIGYGLVGPTAPSVLRPVAREAHRQIEGI